jgi:hypothetical protein
VGFLRYGRVFRPISSETAALLSTGYCVAPPLACHLSELGQAVVVHDHEFFRPDLLRDGLGRLREDRRKREMLGNDTADESGGDGQYEGCSVLMILIIVPNAVSKTAIASTASLGTGPPHGLEKHQSCPTGPDRI